MYSLSFLCNLVPPSVLHNYSYQCACIFISPQLCNNSNQSSDEIIHYFPSKIAFNSINFLSTYTT